MYIVSLKIFRRPYLEFFRQILLSFVHTYFIILITTEFSLVALRKLLKLGNYMITTFLWHNKLIYFLCKNPFKIPQESPAFWKDSWECFMPYISLMQSPNLLIKLCMPYLKNLFWTNWTKSIDIQLKYFVNIFKVNHESFLT